MSDTTPNVSDLFRHAQADGLVSGASMQALGLVDLGAQIQAGLGVSVDDVPASEVVLVTMMPDDSASIRFAGNADAVRDGHNAVLDALAGASRHDGILCHTRYLNGHVLYPYGTLEHAVRMDVHNYGPRHGTPLYDQSVVLLGTVLAKSQEFADAGVAVRSVTLVITDGGDTGSRATPRDVAALVRDLQMAETHLVAGLGIDDGSTDFRRVFHDMGIEDRWILTPASDPKAIRAAFELFSRSAVSLSQANAAVPVGGGFASP